MKKIAVWLPLICGSMLAAGVWLGSLIPSGYRVIPGNEATEKIKAVMGYVERYYVDSVNRKELTEKTITSMLQSLDPHSDYFSAEQIKVMNEPLRGNFEGIGIEYNFIRDTLVVMDVIRNGPSEKAGLHPGDKIISADGKPLTGKEINDKSVRAQLRGPSGTKVKVGVKRYSEKSIREFEIVRGSVPIYSVEASYMLNAETGYIRLARFAETSYEEFKQAGDSLLRLGMKKMVLDLRGNGGGLLNIAVSIADEFLESGKMIVYTKGRADGREDYKATARGRFEKMPLAVLVDENSASASEIIAGAIQDNDRGIIIGRRTFGKGLVQEEKVLADGSAFRLTIARYYTPTGRCIQKPYSKGIDDYLAEETRRYHNGELIHADSVHFPDSLKFRTPKGKVVYGGGGIMPDIFVPLDTSRGSGYLNELYYNNIFTVWALRYAADFGAALKKKGPEDFRKNFKTSRSDISQLSVIAHHVAGIKADNNAIQKSESRIHNYMKAYLSKVLWGDTGYFMIWNDADAAIQKALESLN
ncbi:MAG: S41 family peptidase [Bacteroidia bacterium]